ncbi:MAG: hypothetical protein LBH44_00375 [Treponema sp.]|jgi:hypothetical protein|nr:hypothetical protein [Treponema sp.]
MTFAETLAKRNEARDRRNSLVKHDLASSRLLNAEYDWGFWDAVISIMKNCGMKELDEKAVQG